MNQLEKIADDLGQVVFRLETNQQTLQSRYERLLIAAAKGGADTPIPSTDQVLEIQKLITSDLEKLKDIKGRILEMDGSSEKQ